MSKLSDLRSDRKLLVDTRTTGLGLGKKKNLWVNRAFMMKILFIKALIGKSVPLSDLRNV